MKGDSNNLKVDFDKRIRDGFNDVLSEIPDPDVDAAWEKINTRRNKGKNHRTKLLVVAASFALVVIVLTAVPEANALRGFVQKTIVRLTGQTLELFQSGNIEDTNSIVSQPEVFFYNSLSSYKKERPPGFFTPGDQFENIFVSAEIQEFENQVLKIVLHFYFESEHDVFLEQLPNYGQRSRGRAIDTDDITVKEFMVNDLEITAFQHKSGQTTFTWYTPYAFNTLYGDIPLATLLKYGNELQLFD